MATDSVTGARSAFEVLARTRGLLDPDLRTAVLTLPGALRKVAGYQLGWWDSEEKPTAGDGGKAIRPAFTLVCAEAVGGSAVDALPAAVAVELVHNFSLLHDDVMDADITRRHRATAWTVFGVPQAILAGDAMTALASKVLTATGSHWAAPAVALLNESVVQLCEGQFSDVEFERAGEIDLVECELMVAGKTASLLGVSCALGALAGGADLDAVRRLDEFGRRIGLAFQLIDDVLAIWGEPEVTGKPRGEDLVRRKKSLPVVAALCSGTEAGRELDEIYRSSQPVDVAKAGALVEAAGAREWARERAQDEIDLAIACLDAVKCAPQPRVELVQLANLVTRRTS